MSRAWAKAGLMLLVGGCSLSASPLVSAAYLDSLLGENSRVSVDLSSRGIYSGRRGWSLNAVGLDVHSVISGSRGDVGTFTFQPYLLRIDNAPRIPALFDDGHDSALQWRITNFNYTGLAHGRFNVRVGHFELPFGLEQVFQSNGTLQQVNSPTGLKADWGASINGTLPAIEYEAAYMLGSGNEFDLDSTSVLVGRLGKPQGDLWWVGLSYLDGDFQAPGEPLSRRRVGLDVGVQLVFGFSMMSEYAQGDNQGQDIEYKFVALNWQNSDQSFGSYVQWRESRVRVAGDWEDTQFATFGFKYEPGPRWSGSLMFEHATDSRAFGGRNQVSAQLRYRR